MLHHGNYGMTNNFWTNKKVLISGHSGFKGSWLTLMLHRLGAKVVGYSLEPKKLSLFNTLNINKYCKNYFADIRDYQTIKMVMDKQKPEIIFHLAAQPLVLGSYHDPLYNFETNINGTINLLEIFRKSKNPRVFINVTSDKCYKNDDKQGKSFIETDCLGGEDPYSASKACSEIITNAYRSSFYQKEGISLSSARAGNVIGGGDWSDNRLIPDIIRSVVDSDEVIIRNPESTRPWQFVLDPLRGYLILAEKMYNNPSYDQAWNFGPSNESNISVKEMLTKVSEHLVFKYKFVSNNKKKESVFLNLNSDKAITHLNFERKFNINDALSNTILWYKKFLNNDSNLYKFSIDQVDNAIGMN
jgi:CDP-glucose 4,6-dehydratase